MDRSEPGCEGSGSVVSGQADTGENMSNLVNRVNQAATETIILVLPERTEIDRGEKNEVLGVESASLDCNNEPVGGSAEVEDISSNKRQQHSNDVGTSDNSNSCNSVDRVVLETVIIIESDGASCVNGDNERSETKVSSGLGLSKAPVKSRTKIPELKINSCLIDVKYKGGKGIAENWDGEKICRICLLSSHQSLDGTNVNTSSTELIQLGCGCKDELGIAHGHCAETWFKVKGNRMCEICGETAKNVAGVGNNRFMEEWNEGRSNGSGGNSGERNGVCWQGHPFWNFLMVCLVVAFVLPWFFRINVF